MKKILMFAAVAATFVSCGGGGGRPTFGDNEFPVTTAGTSSADMQSTYPAALVRRVLTCRARTLPLLKVCRT